MKFEEVMPTIMSAGKRGASTWVLSDPPPGSPPRNVAALTVISSQTVTNNKSYMTVLGLTRESLQGIRDEADELLKALDK